MLGSKESQALPTPIAERAPLEALNDPMMIVFAVLGVAGLLFASGRVRLDIVGLLAVLALILTGVLTPREALAGFGDPVVILVAALALPFISPLAPQRALLTSGRAAVIFLVQNARTVLGTVGLYPVGPSHD